MPPATLKSLLEPAWALYRATSAAISSNSSVLRAIAVLVILPATADDSAAADG
jgi:hypothetical protein